VTASARVVRVPAGRPVPVELWLGDGKNRALCLVTRADHFERLEELGLDVALVPRRFSVTDSRADRRARLGRLIMPWRWRRLLLNEGVTRLSAPIGFWPLPIMVGALMAGVRVRWVRR
jgi:hypothetical protein